MMLYWKRLERRLEEARLQRDITEMQHILGLMTEFVRRYFGSRRDRDA